MILNFSSLSILTNYCHYLDFYRERNREEVVAEEVVAVVDEAVEVAVVEDVVVEEAVEAFEVVEEVEEEEEEVVEEALEADNRFVFVEVHHLLHNFNFYATKNFSM